MAFETKRQITSGGGGGSLSIGEVIGGGTPTEILYTDNSGDLYSDALMTRDSVTNYSRITRTFDSPATTYTATVSDLFLVSITSGIFTVGENITNTTSGGTAILENIGNPGGDLFFLNITSGTFSPSDYISGDSSSAIAIISNTYPTSFVLNQGVYFYDNITSSFTGFGTISNISGNVYTITDPLGILVNFQTITDNTNSLGVYTLSSSVTNTQMITGFKTDNSFAGLAQGSYLSITDTVNDITMDFGVFDLSSFAGTRTTGGIVSTDSISGAQSLFTISEASSPIATNILKSDGSGNQTSLIVEREGFSILSDSSIGGFAEVSTFGDGFIYLRASENVSYSAQYVRFTSDSYPTANYWDLTMSAGTAGQALISGGNGGMATWQDITVTTTADPTEILYKDSVGDITGDALFTRVQGTTQTELKTDLALVPSSGSDYISGFQSGALLGGAAYGSGITITDPNDSTKYGFDAMYHSAGDSLVFSNGVFDMTNTNFIAVSGELDDGALNSEYVVNMVNTSNSYSGKLQINQNDARIEHSELVQLVSPTEIIVRTSSGATDWWSLPLTRGAGAGYVLTDVLGNGVTSWEPSAGGATSPGGLTTQVQFNDGGSFGGDIGLLFDKSDKSFFVGDNQTLRGISNTINNTAFTESWESIKSVIGAVAFTGAGLDDMTVSGDYNSNIHPTTYTITVTSNGTPDTFDWTDTNGGSGTGVAMSSSPIFLSDNVYIQFAATTGHTIGDVWDFTYSLTTMTWGYYDSASNQLMWGDIGSVFNGNSIQMDFDSGIINLDSRQAIKIGDIGSTGNTTQFEVNDTTKTIQSSVEKFIVQTTAGTDYLNINTTSGYSTFGNIAANYIYVDTAANDVIGLTANRVAIGNISPSSRLTIAATAGTGANQGAFKLTSSDILATPEAGSVEFYNEKWYLTPTSGARQSVPGVLFTQTANSTVANTVTETSIVGTGVGSMTLPADFFESGKTIRLRGYGFHSSTGAPTVRLRIKLGSTTILDTTAVTSHTATNAQVDFEGIITARTTGATGTVIGQGFYEEYQNPSVATGMVNTATTTIDTTAQQTVTATIQWGTADPGNTITMTNLTLEVLN